MAPYITRTGRLQGSKHLNVECTQCGSYSEDGINCETCKPINNYSQFLVTLQGSVLIQMVVGGGQIIFPSLWTDNEDLGNPILEPKTSELAFPDKNDENLKRWSPCCAKKRGCTCERPYVIYTYLGALMQLDYKGHQIYPMKDSLFEKHPAYYPKMKSTIVDGQNFFNAIMNSYGRPVITCRRPGPEEECDRPD